MEFPLAGKAGYELNNGNTLLSWRGAVCICSSGEIDSSWGHGWLDLMVKGWRGGGEPQRRLCENEHVRDIDKYMNIEW